MDIIIGIFVALAIAIFSPIAVTWLASSTLTKLKQEQALKRYKAEPYMKAGTQLLKVRQGGTDKEVCGPCYIESIDQGRIELVGNNGSWAMFFTLVEFEAMDPVIALVPDNS